MFSLQEEYFIIQISEVKRVMARDSVVGGLGESPGPPFQQIFRMSHVRD